MARKDLIEALEEARGSRVICYFTGDRRNQETQIGDDVLPCFFEHLTRIGSCQKLDLLIYSRGGSTLTGFAIANALREFSSQVNVLAPFRAQSCATLIALGANNIVAGPFAQLSPIDPTIQTPHGPTIEQEGKVQFLPVSVEDVANFFALARNEAGLKDEHSMAAVMGHLCGTVKPLALGAVYRAREQIGMLAKKLLSLHMNDDERIERIARQLTRELGSHDYIVGRREAKEIGLPLLNANDNESTLMWGIYDDVAQELKLGEPWFWEREGQLNQPRTSVRGIVESRDLKHAFTSVYQIKRVTGSHQGQKTETLQMTTTDEAWKKV